MNKSKVHVMRATLAAAVLLVAFTPMTCRAWMSGRQAAALVDPNSIREVQGDMPAGWELYSEDRPIYMRGVGPFQGKLIQLRSSWHGRKMNPEQRLGPGNPVVEYVAVEILIFSSPEGARMGMEALATGRNVAQPAIRGTYSGRSLGELAYRPSGSSSRMADLAFVRGPVYFSVGIKGPRDGSIDCKALAESVAIALDDRAKAAMDFAGAPETTAVAVGRNLPARAPRGIPVARMKDYADAAGAALKVDILGGTAEVRRGNNILKVNIGRTEAWLNGKAITLPFPALRSGKDQVYCPLETLQKL